MRTTLDIDASLLEQVMQLDNLGADLRSVLKRLSEGDEPVFITEQGREVAVMIRPDVYESWLETLEILSDTELVEALKEAERDIKANRVLSFEEVTGEPL